MRLLSTDATVRTRFTGRQNRPLHRQPCRTNRPGTLNGVLVVHRQPPLRRRGELGPADKKANGNEERKLLKTNPKQTDEHPDRPVDASGETEPPALRIVEIKQLRPVK